LPDPWALNWNDHVPANFRLGMDGYFYVATGDKGLHGAKGTDGSTIEMNTGGIFRIKPDGSGLEVFSHGVRNILDVAMNEEDELFTYDNTDEHDWMGRFTHMQEAGFYGYPHDFKPRRPYTLWMMHDFGAGAATGAFAYTEDALPKEYHGNVFIADFGKRQVTRVVVEREGATYKVKSSAEMFPNPPADFRPVGITGGADGKSIYICDWQHRDEKENVAVGRLWRLTWQGADESAPKPAWYLRAARGEKVTEVSKEDLEKGLGHPARAVRMAAQRTLATRQDSGEGLKRLLNDAGANDLARMHALWALGRRLPSNEVGQLLRDSMKQGNNILVRQILRSIHGRLEEPLQNAVLLALKSKEATIRFAAATALGRVETPLLAEPRESILALLQALNEPEENVRYAVFTALNRQGRKSRHDWSRMLEGFGSPNERVREGITFAIRETYETNLVVALRSFLGGRQPEEARVLAIKALAELHHRAPTKQLSWWAYHPALQTPPKKSEAWGGTELVLEGLRQALLDESPNVRLQSIAALANANDTKSATLLREMFSGKADIAVQAAALEALGSLKDDRAQNLWRKELQEGRNPRLITAALRAAESAKDQAALIGFLNTHKKNEDEVRRGIQAMEGIDAPLPADLLAEFSAHRSAEVRAAAIRTVRSMLKDEGLPVALKAMEDRALPVQQAALSALKTFRSGRSVPILIKKAQEPALREEAMKVLLQIPDKRALPLYLEALESKNTTLRNAAILAIRNVQAEVRGEVEAKISTLSARSIADLRQIYAGDTSAQHGPIFGTKIQQTAPEEYLKYVSKNQGDSGRGRKLFADAQGLNCIGCHKVAGQGAEVGPDLSGIGVQFDRAALAESILYPSKVVREGYQQTLLEVEGEEDIGGILKSENAENVTMRDATGREVNIPKAKIRNRRLSQLSLMPDGLQAALSLQDFADLVAYLSSLRP
jgi:putative heme-binding domain-containing protein